MAYWCWPTAKPCARADDPFMGDTIRRQLGEADLILLSKCDVPAPADLAATEAWLASEALTAAVVPMTATTPPPRAVLFDLAAPAPWRHSGTDTLGHDQAYDSLIPNPAASAWTPTRSPTPSPPGRMAFCAPRGCYRAPAMVAWRPCNGRGAAASGTACRRRAAP